MIISEMATKLPGNIRRYYTWIFDDLSQVSSNRNWFKNGLVTNGEVKKNKDIYNKIIKCFFEKNDFLVDKNIFRDERKEDEISKNHALYNNTGKKNKQLSEENVIASLGKIEMFAKIGIENYGILQSRLGEQPFFDFGKVYRKVSFHDEIIDFGVEREFINSLSDGYDYMGVSQILTALELNNEGILTVEKISFATVADSYYERPGQFVENGEWIKDKDNRKLLELYKERVRLLNGLKFYMDRYPRLAEVILELSETKKKNDKSTTYRTIATAVPSDILPFIPDSYKFRRDYVIWQGSDPYNNPIENIRNMAITAESYYLNQRNEFYEEWVMDHNSFEFGLFFTIYSIIFNHNFDNIEDKNQRVIMQSTLKDRQDIVEFINWYFKPFYEQPNLSMQQLVESNNNSCYEIAKIIEEQKTFIERKPNKFWSDSRIMFSSNLQILDRITRHGTENRNDCLKQIDEIREKLCSISYTNTRKK